MNRLLRSIMYLLRSGGFSFAIFATFYTFVLHANFIPTMNSYLLYAIIVSVCILMLLASFFIEKHLKRGEENYNEKK